MEKRDIKIRLRQFIEDNNGKNSWHEYIGSQLEEDISSFVISEVKNCSIPNVVRQSEQLPCDCEKHRIKSKVQDFCGNCETTLL